MITQFWQAINFTVPFGSLSVKDSSHNPLFLYEWDIPAGREAEAQQYAQSVAQVSPVASPPFVPQQFFTKTLWDNFIDANVADVDLRVVLKIMAHGLNPVPVSVQNEYI